MTNRRSSHDDVTRTWYESIAVKITALIVYAIVLIACVVAAFSLRGIEQRLAQEFPDKADHIAYDIAVDMQRHPAVSDDDVAARVSRTLGESGLSAAMIIHGDRTMLIGKPEQNATALERLIPVAGNDVEASSRALRIIFYHAPFHDEVSSRRKMMFLITGTAALILGFALTAVILKFITQPIHALVAATRAVTAGDLSVRVDVSRQDEFGILSTFFNRMIEQISSELTERRRVEAQLRQSNEFIKTALDSMNDAVSVVDVGNFSVRGVNSKFLEEYGLRESDVIGKTCYEVTHGHCGPCMPPDNVCPLLMTLESGGHAVAEHIHHTPDGKEVYAEVSTSPIRDSNGQISQVVRVSRDISIRKQNEEIMRRNREQISNILDSIHAGVLLIHPERHEIVYVNSFAADMIGASRGDIVGRRCHDFVCSAGRGKCPITDLHERVDNSERMLVRANGSPIPILKSVMPMLFNGEDHIIESFIDISGIKKTEQYLRDSNDELQAFIYSASHDMRQPLVNIKGFSGELDRSLQEIQAILMRYAGHLTDEDRDRISAIMCEDIPSAAGYIGLSVDRMSGIVDALLKLSHLGRRVLKPERLDMQAMVRAALDSLNGQILLRDITIVVGDLPVVKADRVAMEQILFTLLDNAAKYLAYNRPGRIEVNGEQLNGEVAIHVRDNGRGMNHEDIPRAFGMFQRVGKQDVPGEGMGLAYVKTLVRRCGGRIWCESRPDEGSTFSFTVPDV